MRVAALILLALLAGILGGKVKAGDVVVIRHEGPRGGPGMQEMLYPTSYIKSKGLGKACALLTDGRPDFLSTKLPAGQTDILVSYTYRIAFRDSGSDFGLAAAISTLIFFLVAALSLINLRLSAKAQK